MIRPIIYFIISSFLLFFSTNVNSSSEVRIFEDREQAIYRIHCNDETQSYSTITLNRVEVLPKTILRTGTPNTFVKAETVKRKYKNFVENDLYEYEINYASILDRYRTRILLI